MVVESYPQDWIIALLHRCPVESTTGGLRRNVPVSTLPVSREGQQPTERGRHLLVSSMKADWFCTSDRVDVGKWPPTQERGETSTPVSVQFERYKLLFDEPNSDKHIGRWVAWSGWRTSLQTVVPANVQRTAKRVGHLSH